MAARSPKVADFFAAVRRSQGIAAILDQPEVMAFRKVGDRVEIERIAQGVGKHYRPGAFRAGVVELAHVDVVSRRRNVDEHGHQAVLQDRD